jgi:GT2 family glycosyltransferase
MLLFRLLRGIGGPGRSAAGALDRTMEIVSATRLTEEAFWEQAPLGRSLRRLSHETRLVPRIAFGNRRGLPEVYNERIAAADRHDLLVFVHDDVWIEDFFLADRIIEGLAAYDVIGVAGNRRRVRNQPAWPWIDDDFTYDDRRNLSGSVAHGADPFGSVSFFGAAPAPCELLDGVFLAANKPRLVARGVRFDPRFDFHFYDMDFCRSAREKGLRLGTWPISLTHRSTGAFQTPAWREKYRAYLEKWES